MTCADKFVLDEFLLDLEEILIGEFEVKGKGHN